jgi:hypothetical protein
MERARKIRQFGLALLSAIAIVACSHAQDSAQHALEGVQSAVTAIAPQAQKYLPDQFATLQTKATNLKTSFEHGDFKQVLADAPGLVNEAQALGAAAAAKKDQIVKSLSAKWPALAASIPDMLAAVQARIDTLAKNKKRPAGVDLNAARTDMAEAQNLWSKAQEAFTPGDVETAVNAAKEAQGKIEAAGAALKLSLPAATSH